VRIAVLGLSRNGLCANRNSSGKVSVRGHLSYQCQKNSSQMAIVAANKAKPRWIDHPSQNAHRKPFDERSPRTTTGDSQTIMKPYSRRLALSAAKPIRGSRRAKPMIANASTMQAPPASAREDLKTGRNSGAAKVRPMPKINRNAKGVPYGNTSMPLHRNREKPSMHVCCARETGFQTINVQLNDHTVRGSGGRQYGKSKGVETHKG
jgi:hypothetical protein